MRLRTWVLSESNEGARSTVPSIANILTGSSVAAAKSQGPDLLSPLTKQRRKACLVYFSASTTPRRAIQMRRPRSRCSCRLRLSGPTQSKQFYLFRARRRDDSMARAYRLQAYTDSAFLPRQRTTTPPFAAGSTVIYSVHQQPLEG